MTAEPNYFLLPNRRPSLPAGKYTVHARLELADVAQNEPIRKETVTYETAAAFVVGGAKRALAPAEVHSLFPAEGSRADVEYALPHIALRRDTLPWERSADGTRNAHSPPWLALILLSEEQHAAHRLQLMDDAVWRARRGVAPEPGAPASIQVVELDQALQAQLPSSKELGLLCHARGALDTASQNLVNSVAIVTGKRVPVAGKNVMHLVALDNLYCPGTQLADRDDARRCTLVSLYSWNFHHVAGDADAAQAGSLFDLFEHVTIAPLSFTPSGGDLLDVSETLVYAARGSVLLPHHYRSGEVGAAWYLGPLQPGIGTSISTPPALPAVCADALYQYDENSGMFDVSYAAAWELGRMLALGDREVSTALAALRRERVLGAHKQRLDKVCCYSHLPGCDNKLASCAPWRAALEAWIAALWQLRGIPFKYLVADEQMLPPNAIRCFTIDPWWIEALIDGALNMALPTTGATCHALDISACPKPKWGMLIRSALVSAWPELTVTATDKHGGPLMVYPCRQYSPSILLFLCDDQPAHLKITQPSQTINLVVTESDVTEPVLGTRLAELSRHADAVTLQRDWSAHPHELDITID